ncbi:CCAAT/enhancer-binding protein gamma [Trichoplusia ni]|uniref:CCAAT/enhancer-binding protein gamma n=1 Tax=Trichoplusia ni TaxID=7111 RepID=A0A7E5VJE1_TRINI|nr:CCAAT/enhancer-binding protein gamma [Trichoplusia ni]
MTLFNFEDYSNDMPPVKRGRRGLSDADNVDDDYRRKRERNNEAVKKSRVKSKQQTKDTFTRVKRLKEENQELEDTTKRLTKELELLKELFLATASNTKNPKFDGLDLEKLLEDTPDKK